jgi:uncharacterized membrane protein YidH (DUF202 family)
MIQRIQTVYFLITLICLGIVSFGADMFSFLSTSMRYRVDAFGVYHEQIDKAKVEHTDSFPGYLIGMGLMIITVFAIMSYKDLKRQHRLGRMLFYTYFIVLASVILMINFGSGRIAADITGREMGLGFFILVIGFPFVFLANTGINRDKKLLDSLNRLR